MMRRVLLRTMLLVVLSDLPLLMMSKRGRVIYERLVLCLYLTFIFCAVLVLCVYVFGHPFMMDMYPCVVVDMSSYIYVMFL